MSDPYSVERIAERVGRELGWNRGVPAVNQFDLHDFSYGFGLSEEASADSVYVKFPRHGFLFDKAQPLFPRSEQDLIQGRQEFDSLAFLDQALSGQEIRFVKPRLLLADLGGVVTSLVKGGDAIERLRELDSASVRGDLAARAELGQSMAQLGQSLRVAHEAGRRGEAHVPWTENRDKVVGLLKEMRTRGCIGKRQLAEWQGLIPAAPTDRNAQMLTVCFKGFDVRNLMQTEDERLLLLDPGAMKAAPVEADIARFMLTVRILYWGRPDFAFGRESSPHTEAAFLEGYGLDFIDQEVLAWYILKEVLKHWRMAHVAVDVKSWSRPFSALVRRLYIDRIYRRSVRRSIHQLRVA